MRLITFLRFSKLKYIINPISGKPIPNTSEKILQLMIDGGNNLFPHTPLC